MCAIRAGSGRGLNTPRASYALLALAILPELLATDAIGRDPKHRAAFRHSHPCPATGKRAGACPGYVVDHIRPLCAGGEDHPRNMQWQTVAEAKVKDRAEAEECRAIRKAGRTAQ